MNSFNHWAFGSVGEWVWRHLVGLEPDPAAPGWRHFFVQPKPDPRIEWIDARYRSVRGWIELSWRRERERLSLRVSVPAGCTATVRLPAKDPGQLLESGRSVLTARGIRSVRTSDAGLSVVVTAGRYRFECPLP